MQPFWPDTAARRRPEFTFGDFYCVGQASCLSTETATGWKSVPLDFGSSPRVRGTLGRQCIPSSWLRFIPACAGNPNHLPTTVLPKAVHPRVCGEPTVSTFCLSVSGGSSPRVRGTPQLYNMGIRNSRFIPACAGNPTDVDKRATKRTVHPRVCGEPDRGFITSLWISGSSPRVRGTQERRDITESLQRFIPACAGNP